MKVFMFVAMGIIALLLLSMPETLETFSGSHEFEISTCEKCHPDKVNTGQVMSNLRCISCHDDNSDQHQVNLTQCKTCHSSADTLYDKAEPHKNVMDHAQESTVMDGENEACFMCHANVDIQFSFSRPRFIEFDIVAENNNWIILNLSVGTVATWTTSNQRNGNSHQWISSTEILCPTCHSDITENISAHYYTSSEHTSEVDCRFCHKKSASQHAAKSILCFESCHNSDHEGNLMVQISEQPQEYQSNICIGCHNHNPENKESPSNTHFKVYLEPIYGVERID